MSFPEITSSPVAAEEDFTSGKLPVRGISLSALRTQLVIEAAFGSVLGLTLGAFAAFNLGRHHGKVAMELFYIDNWEHLPC
jgi:hypothetical protein